MELVTQLSEKGLTDTVQYMRQSKSKLFDHICRMKAERLVMLGMAEGIIGAVEDQQEDGLMT